MKRHLKLLNTAVLILTGVLLYGCINFDTFAIGRVVKPEELKHYEPQGALVAVTINSTYFQLATYFMLMFKDTASFSMYGPRENNYFILDVPFKCNGLSRVGMIFDTQLPEEWFLTSSSFRLESNKVNYLGRFAFKQDLVNPYRDLLIVTNTLEKDRQWFLEYYPTLSNAEFISVPVTNGTFIEE
jgi:hypothetical protein